MRKLWLPTLALTLLVGFQFFSHAQPSGNRIEGTVTDAGGAPLPGARVTLSGSGLPPQPKITGSKGDFWFVVAAPGSYNLAAELTGFAASTRTVEVRAKETARITIALTAVATVAETQAAVSQRALSNSLGRKVASLVGGVVGGSPTASAPYPVAPSSLADASQQYRRRLEPFNTETYDHIDESAFKRVLDNPLSTFSVDVDTASFANTRRFLNSGQLPPADAVRIEELINYFGFDYVQPKGDAPFSVTLELAPCPWNPDNRLALFGLQGRRIEQENVPDRNLVFLIDVSGSMDEPMKLPLLKTGMRMLADQLTARDRVAIVVYAGASGLVLPSTAGDRKDVIHKAIEDLEAGGSTNGGEGIRLAYQIAAEQFKKGAVNRVILATDGDFNVGITSEGELVRLIEQKRETGVSLSVLGFGTGNLKDSTMEQLADKGNGNYSYIDSLHEARKVLVSEAGGTLVTIAKDVKLQVEFNPRTVAAYRLIGYENRVLAAEDFNDDRKDAGEIGAGHAVTALYEIVPVGAGRGMTSRNGQGSRGGDGNRPSVDPLKYQESRELSGAAPSKELLTLKLRYKAPDGDVSRLIETTLENEPRALSANLGFAASVAEFGMLLRGSEHKGDATFAEVLELATRFRGPDPHGYRAEFIKLVELAQSLSAMQTSQRD
jgi:Ca-activated chloride channel family protein